MKQIWRVAFVFLVLAACVLPAAADKASSLFSKGRDAEARQDYEAAYTYYAQAYQLKPKNLSYRTAATRLRVLAGAMHVRRGQQLRDDGKLAEALAEFQKAALIDPASFIAQQEIRRTQIMIDAANAGAAVQPPAPQAPFEAAAGPVELAPVNDAPITMKMTADAKTIYQFIGKYSGLNVLFDPDWRGTVISVELNNVTLMEALEIVAMQSKTFWRPVTPNTIYIAQDSPQKRREVEQNVVRTLYLSNLSQATDLQDIVNALRTIMGQEFRVQPIMSQSAIVVKGSPDQVMLAEKLINDLDKAKPEVIVEVAVMQVSRDKIRNLGINPPTSATIQLKPNVTTTTNGTTTTDTTTTGTSSTNTINLNRLGNLTAKDFVVTIPQASVNFLFSDSNTTLIQNPQIRALDGQKASLKIGQRVPVATGSFQPGVGTIGVNPLVNTQFQYLDVGVNVDITPTVHSSREVTLKLSLDISAVDSKTNIGGIEQPVIGQRKIEHTIRLKEGEANLMGGILEDQDIKALSGYPWISSVPILKYLFSSENTEKRQNEIVFVLTPHIVRAQELTSLNTRALDVGTANTIELRRSRPAPKPQAPAQTPAPAPAPPQPSSNGVPPQASNGAATAGTQGVVLSFNPPQTSTSVGQTFMVDVVANGAQNLFSAPMVLKYDSSRLELLNISNGSLLAQGEQAVALVHRDDPGSGTLQVTATRPPNSGGATGQGSLFTLTFRAKAGGQAGVSISGARLRSASNQDIAASGTPAVIEIKQSTSNR